MIGLGTLPFGLFFSKAYGVSGDGSVVVGDNRHDLGTEAFYWTSGGGLVGMGDLPGLDLRSRAYDISADGSVVVGFGYTLLGFEAFIWDAANGMQNLKAILQDKMGLDLTGWRLIEATGISADGLTIVGWGDNPDDQREAWIATRASAPNCRSDFNVDGFVNVTDMLELLASWGANPGHRADTSGDGVVNVTDLLALLGAWGQCPALPKCRADFNFDGIVNVTDLLKVLASWGTCP